MAHLGFIQHRLGRTDGVSLEVDKYRAVLERQGHTVSYLAGNEDVPGGACLPELYPFHPVTQRILQNATRALTDYASPAELMREVRAHADRIKPGILDFIRTRRLDLLFPQNLLSVGYNLPGMLALCEAIEETGIPVVAHHHDFWWEDSGEVYPTCDEVIDFYTRYAPPVGPGIKHLVINRLAQQELKRRKGAEARVVPNVFDFSQPPWQVDAYNADFRQALGLAAEDIVCLQATRVLDRKGIELAIDLVAALQAPANRRMLEAKPLFDGRRFGPGQRIVLLCAGYVEGIGLRQQYPTALRHKAREAGVEIIWAGEHIQHHRSEEKGRKRYSLWDAYTAADLVSYPSYWEGWGNQLIEAIFARLPVVLFEYPVFRSDLEVAEFDFISLGSRLGPRDPDGLVTVAPTVIEQAATRAVAYLQSPELRAQTAEHNFQRAKRHFSYATIEALLREIFAEHGLRWDSEKSPPA